MTQKTTYHTIPSGEKPAASKSREAESSEAAGWRGGVPAPGTQGFRLSDGNVVYADAA